jgi:outer membrane protein OmpA-like peptidoglycan-associated protein
MSNRFAVLLGTAALAVLAQAALADETFTPTQGGYLGAAAGGSFPLNADFGPTTDTDYGLGAPHGKADFDAGWGAFLDIGYGFGNGFRAELEGGWMQNDVSSIENASTSASGRARLRTLMVNGIYDIDLGGPLVPHIGAGMGLANMNFNNVGTFVNPTVGASTVSGTATVFGYDAILGADYLVAPGLSLTLDYRFIGADTGTFSANPGGHADVSYQTNVITVGLKWDIDQPVPPAPVVAPPPPPAPPAPPPAPVVEQKRSFQVFFDFDKSNITAAAAKVIEAASDAIKAGHYVQITVTGHTDTVGSAAYNQGLSERRAASVKSELVKDGVAGGEITTLGVGKNGLLVPTADGVREPQNRRAEIVLQ